MYRLICLALFTLALTSGCQQSGDEPGVQVDIATDPSPPKVGLAKLTLEVRGADGKPAAGAALKREGNVSHAGMRHVFAALLTGERRGILTTVRRWWRGCGCSGACA